MKELPLDNIFEFIEKLDDLPDDTSGDQGNRGVMNQRESIRSVFTTRRHPVWVGFFGVLFSETNGKGIVDFDLLKSIPFSTMGSVGFLLRFDRGSFYCY